MAGKFSSTIYASAARTATPTAVTRDVDRYRGCLVLIDVTAIAATPSVVPKIEGVTASGAVYAILTGAAITATGQTALKVYPGITAAANVAVSDVLPQKIKVTLTHGDADSITYSVDLVLIP
ncbi:MAG TPA: hypothetical protein VGP91_18075 [Actinoplanes sp.]|jgi:hypothetical protein|nr:hypothetical protein [Actinoplanes sp.]